MKILLTGGGTGGHFYPMIAVARALKKQAELENIAKVELFFASDSPYDPSLLLGEGIRFLSMPSGKLRRYFSFKYISDFFKTAFGILISFWKIYSVMPDVVFSKGGYSGFPALFWARVFKIPTIIHESDSVPGIVNDWAAKWAARIAVSFPESIKYFEGRDIALTGNPVRSQIIGGNLREALEQFKLEENLPTLLILGGSQGAERINEAIISALPDLVKNYQLIHQTGKANFEDVSARTNIVLEKSEFKSRYHVYPFLDENDLRNASCASSLVISRAGASAIYEIAAWALPSIIIPIQESARNHQRQNAYAYARAGGCEVLEETNLSPHLLIAQVEKILNNPDKIKKMKEAAQAFSRLDAADRIAKEIIKLGVHD